jgi:hypothetical protein
MIYSRMSESNLDEVVLIYKKGIRWFPRLHCGKDTGLDRLFLGCEG